MVQKSHRTRVAFAAIAVAMVSFSSLPAHALKTDDDTLVEGAKLCTRYLPRQERMSGIPEHLLAAIASTESGRFHRALGMNLPWPWTINVEGTGYFFDTKQEAIDAVKDFQARGFASIDVGCMQVNLFHHPNAFATLDQAFDPAYNVAYGAQFLKKNFDEEGNWRKATADYHSRSLFYGEPYARLVYSAWSRIINKVADARAGRPILSASASRPSSSGPYGSTRVHTSYHPMHMHSISVARHEDETRENGVIVIRPDLQESQAAITRAPPSSDDTGFVRQATVVEPASDMIERTAITPNGYSGENPNGPEIVKVHSDGTGSAQGQFQPSSHVIRASDMDSGNAAISPGGSEDSGKSPFVFNN